MINVFTIKQTINLVKVELKPLLFVNNVFSYAFFAFSNFITYKCKTYIYIFRFRHIVFDNELFDTFLIKYILRKCILSIFKRIQKQIKRTSLLSYRERVFTTKNLTEEIAISKLFDLLPWIRQGKRYRFSLLLRHRIKFIANNENELVMQLRNITVVYKLCKRFCAHYTLAVTAYS